MQQAVSQGVKARSPKMRRVVGARTRFNVTGSYNTRTDSGSFVAVGGHYVCVWSHALSIEDTAAFYAFRRLGHRR